MSEPKITFTREELYEKVWTTPMQKLATEFGFSDRGLAKRSDVIRCLFLPGATGHALRQGKAWDERLCRP